MKPYKGKQERKQSEDIRQEVTSSLSVSSSDFSALIWNILLHKDLCDILQQRLYWRLNGFVVMPSADGLTKKPFSIQIFCFFFIPARCRKNNKTIQSPIQSPIECSRFWMKITFFSWFKIGFHFEADVITIKNYVGNKVT
jgi:hypothetical protein